MLKIDGQITTWQTVQPNQKFKFCLKQISSLVNALERNFFESQKNDRLLLMALRNEFSQKDSLNLRLQEALQEKQQVMDEVELRNQDNLGTSVSTMSLVHLQYKYEELLANYRGLLRLLELKSDEIKKHIAENDRMKEQMEKLAYDLGVAEDKMQLLQRKLSDFRNRKRDKIARLKAEGRSLALVHRRLVAFLHRQCMEKNNFVNSLLKTTSSSEKALLLQEVRKNNILSYENFQMQQELHLLRSVFDASKCQSRQSLTSDKS